MPFVLLSLLDTCAFYTRWSIRWCISQVCVGKLQNKIVFCVFVMSYCVFFCVVVSCMCWPGVHLSRMCWSAKMDWCTLPHTGCPRILCSWSFSSAEKVLILFNKAAPAQNWQYFAQLCPEMQTFLFLYIFLKTKMTDNTKFLVPLLCSHSTTPWLWGKVHHMFVLWKSSRP